MILNNNKNFTHEAHEEYEKVYENLNKLLRDSFKKGYTIEEFNFIVTTAINDLFLDYRMGVNEYP